MPRSRPPYPDEFKRRMLASETEVMAALEEDGFRVERPVATRGGGWVHDGWSAWTFLTGKHELRGRVGEVLATGRLFHSALSVVARPPALDRRGCRLRRWPSSRPFGRGKASRQTEAHGALDRLLGPWLALFLPILVRRLIGAPLAPPVRAGVALTHCVGEQPVDVPGRGLGLRAKVVPQRGAERGVAQYS